MDPIEKVLSDLAPARNSGDLDRAMERIFRRAEAKVRRRTIVRRAAIASLFLMAGTGIGFTLGKAAAPKNEPPAVAQVVHNEAPVVRTKPIFDFTVTTTWPHAPLMQVTTQPAPSAGV